MYCRIIFRIYKIQFTWYFWKRLSMFDKIQILDPLLLAYFSCHVFLQHACIACFSHTQYTEYQILDILLRDFQVCIGSQNNRSVEV